MKLNQLREGMILERVTREFSRNDISKYWIILEIEVRQKHGIERSDIWVKNLGHNDILSCVFEHIANPKRWLLLEGAELQQLLVKRLVFVDERNPIEMSCEVFVGEPEASTAPVSKSKVGTVIHYLDGRSKDPIDQELADELEKLEEEPSREEVSAKVDEVDVQENDSDQDEKDQVIENLTNFASCTIDDWEFICDTLVHRFIHNGQFDPTHKRPKNGSKSAQVYSQEWSAFKDNQYTVREVRKLGLRIHGDFGTPCTYQTVLIRLVKGCFFYGSANHRQFITHGIQKRNRQAKAIREGVTKK